MPSGVVLVTGASTGIGEATALHLRELGFEPVAGVRRDEDAERLGGEANLPSASRRLRRTGGGEPWRSADSDADARRSSGAL